MEKALLGVECGAVKQCLHEGLVSAQSVPYRGSAQSHPACFACLCSLTPCHTLAAAVQGWGLCSVCVRQPFLTQPLHVRDASDLNYSVIEVSGRAGV